MDPGPAAAGRLRERLPGYLLAFSAGLVAGALVGLVVWWASPAGLGEAAGYTYIGLGALLMLAGGMRGSGYGAPGTRASEERDPVARRRARLAGPPNPSAFWEVVAGAAYLGLGVLLGLAFGTPAP